MTTFHKMIDNNNYLKPAEWKRIKQLKTQNNIKYINSHKRTLKPRSYQKKYASIRSSGYGGGSSAAPNAKSKAATKLPSLNEKQPNHSYGYSKRTNNARQLPPLNRGFR